MRSSALRNLSPLKMLSLFVFLLLTVAIFVTISFSLRQQRLTSKAWSTVESARAECNAASEVDIAVKFSNVESSDSLMPINVSVKDVQTGLVVDMGTVDPSKTGTALIQTHRKQIDGSSVMFFLSGTNNSSDTDQRGAVYTQVSCELTPTRVPTSIPTKIPTPTTEVSSTYFKLDVVLNGIGAGGDRVNLKGKGNQNPIHKVRTVTVDVVNDKNDLIMSKSGDLIYESDSGHFIGKIDMGRTLKTGVYLIKVKGDQYLQAIIPGIKSIQSGKINVLGEVDLMTGDFNNDNVINVLDYNLLMGCYSDLHPAVSCDGGRLKAADLTDDGVVNQFDYNLFLRDLTTSVGS